MKINKKKVKIVSYKKKYKNKFKKLSYEWLNKYDLFEKEDEIILNNPEKVILDKGGFIYFAKYQNEIVGTISLISEDNNIFEIAKLAVTEKYQNNGIAKMLIEKALNTAKNEEIDKLILYSNSKLNKAYELYKNYGFKDIKISKNKYETADIKMELNLN